MRSATDKIIRFYLYDMCWPYTASFLLTLIIYLMDDSMHGSIGWAGISAYAILFFYYTVNIYYFISGRLVSRDNRFFIFFLTVKILIWGGIIVYSNLASDSL